MLYSEVFKTMKIDKEVSWAIVRILKGDFINFMKLIKNADSDDCPTNSRKFLKIVSYMAGAKNCKYHYLDTDTPVEFDQVINIYRRLHRKKKAVKGNSKEYATLQLRNFLGINPLWSILEASLGFKKEEDIGLVARHKKLVNF